MYVALGRFGWSHSTPEYVYDALNLETLVLCCQPASQKTKLRTTPFPDFRMAGSLQEEINLKVTCAKAIAVGGAG